MVAHIRLFLIADDTEDRLDSNPRHPMKPSFVSLTPTAKLNTGVLMDGDLSRKRATRFFGDETPQGVAELFAVSTSSCIGFEQSLPERIDGTNS
jgi:hypothetical protein